MRYSQSKTLCFLAFFVCLAGVAFADPPRVTMQLLAPPPGNTLAGVYTSPYTALIDGVPTLVICDDFSTEVTTNTAPWEATAVTVAELASLPPSAVKYTAGTIEGNAIDQDTAYTIAAYLAVAIMSTDQSTVEGQTLAGELSFSLWGLFDPTAFTFLTGQNLTNALNFLVNAQATVQNQNLTVSSFPNVTVYTPDPLSASQEFLRVSLPEPAFVAVLGGDLLVVAALILVGRRRSRAIAN
jgi:hypothetical protein